jgi:HEAT repeat protein
VGANLILRSGRAPELVHEVLLELEYTMKPPPAAPRPPRPPEWRPMLEAMRSELKPGFAREDGVTTSQPLTALHHVATDKALVPRLKPLLRHPAFVPRIYVAMTLGKLQATETLPDLLAMVREGYPFSDAVALASGKHFDQSQTVRWRGFLCMAVGRMGGDEARVALEQFASDPKQPRDIRYSSVVGLGFIGSPKSLAVLRQVATNDIIWMVRDEARRAAADIEVLAAEGGR